MRRITGLPYAAVVPEPLPLFPLNTPLVPGLVLPLHIFEPRYRQLVEDLLARPDEDEREFGIVAIRDGYEVERDGLPALYPVGTAAILRQAERLDDGRFDIVTTGSRRFRLLDVDFGQPLLRGAVEFLEDVDDPSDAVLARRVARRFLQYRAALSGRVVDTGDDDVSAGVDDDAEDAAELPDDPTVLSYLVTAAMVLPVGERQVLLSADTTAERLRLAQGLLARETALITTLGAVPSIDLPGSAPSVN